MMIAEDAFKRGASIAHLSKRVKQQRRIIESHPSDRPPEPESYAVPIEQMYRVRDVAKKLGMSVDWTLRHFKASGAVVSIPSPARRGKRKYCTNLIPESALLREARKLGLYQ